MIDGHKHNSTMVSDASPGTAAPKMKESFVHMAHVSSYCACAQDCYLKRPHLTIIDGDTVDPTNRNRQLQALTSTHGLNKAVLIPYF
jgi:hypothetical protein